MSASKKKKTAKSDSLIRQERYRKERAKLGLRRSEAYISEDAINAIHDTMSEKSILKDEAVDLLIKSGRKALKSK